MGRLIVVVVVLLVGVGYICLMSQTCACSSLYFNSQIALV